MIAFLPSLGWQEMFLLMVIGLLLYGRDLPDAGRKLGRVVAKLKRGFQDFKEQIDRDDSLREMRKAIDDVKREVRDVSRVPNAVRDPSAALRDLTHEAMSTPLADEPTGEPVNERADEPPALPPATTTPSAAPAVSQPATPSPDQRRTS